MQEVQIPNQQEESQEAVRARALCVLQHAQRRHFKKISDSTITSQEAADNRARLEIVAHSGIKKKGTMTINGRENMSTSFMFSANLTNYGINERFEVVSYTQRITPQEGFITEINYGKQQYDIVKE